MVTGHTGHSLAGVLSLNRDAFSKFNTPNPLSCAWEGVSRWKPSLKEVGIPILPKDIIPINPVSIPCLRRNNLIKTQPNARVIRDFA